MIVRSKFEAHRREDPAQKCERAKVQSIRARCRAPLAGLLCAGAFLACSFASTPRAHAQPPPSAALWTRLPSREDVKRYYPEAAFEAGIEGAATINCRVNNRLLLEDCSLVDEAPKGQGFGAAALRMVSLYKARDSSAPLAPDRRISFDVAFSNPENH
jgi:hypothetical protein